MRIVKWAAHAAVAATAGSAAAASAQRPSRWSCISDVKIIDPFWTTAYIVRNYGYMVYDTLLAVDEKLAGQAADAGRLEGERRQAHLHLHPARRA